MRPLPVAVSAERGSADSYLIRPKRAVRSIPARRTQTAFLSLCYLFSVTTLTDINALDEDAFVRLLGGIFERSPWVARRAFAGRPFASRAALHAAMVDVVKRAPSAEHVALLNAHPELAGKEARAGRLTASSSAEQSSAGLDALTPVEHERVAQLNRDYRARFGFPFIIAVRDHDRRGILAEFERRLREDTATELANGLDQVYRIAEIRLEGVVDTNDRDRDGGAGGA